MIDRKYLVCKHGDFSAENDFFSECQERQVPYILVSRRTKHASVSWDHISLPSSWDQLLTANSDAISAGLLAVFERWCNSKSKYSIGALAGSVETFDLASAESAAAEIHEILMSHLTSTTAS